MRQVAATKVDASGSHVYDCKREDDAMVKVLTELGADEPEGGNWQVRAVPVRRGKKRSARVRTKSRRTAPKPGGIHRRAHKRMTW